MSDFEKEIEELKQEDKEETKEVMQGLGRTVAWFAVAAVGALVVVLCLLVLYLMGVF
jgi:cobalamin biosynthesis Mg chelatase CobN